MRLPASLLMALLFPLGAASAPAAAQAQSAATGLDPAGTYDLDLEMHGQINAGLLTVAREQDGRLTGTLEVHGHGISFDRGTLEDRELTLRAGSNLTLTLTFTTDSAVTGSWSRPDDSGGVSGVRRKS